MKSGVTLQQMMTEVKRQSESKEDYLIAPNRLRMESYGKEMFLHLSDDSGTELIEPMTITGIAHRQIGTHLRIPAAYYDRMREERPDLLAYNANTWFKQENSQRMLRTLDGSARAYLSNRYRRIDNIDIAGVTLPILGGLPDIRFESCQITESRMYIKAVNPRLQAEVSPGDIVQAGVIINFGLGWLNLLPIPPLDGSKVVAYFLPLNVALRYLSIERFGFLILLGLLFTGLLSMVLGPLVGGSARGLLTLLGIL